MKSAVYNFRSEPEGAGFRLTGLTPFMEQVQATDVDFGPDSRLYVSAWDEGWDRTDQGRIFRVSHEAARKAQAAQIAEVQQILAEGFDKRGGEEIVKLLAHPDRRVRLGAQWAIGEKLVAAGRKADRATSLDLGERLSKAIQEGVAGPRKDLSQLHAIWASGYVVRMAVNDLAKRGGGNPPLYETIVASVDGGLVTTGSGLPIMTVALATLDGMAIDTLIAPDGCKGDAFHAPPALVAWIARRASTVR